jgi:CRP-like cAMP-binding protein
MDDFDAIDDQFAANAKRLMDDSRARFAALRGCAFFQPVPDDWLRRLTEMTRVRTFHSDVSIASQDDEVKAFYVILYGAADAYRNGKLVGTIEAGDCFGEGIFFSDGALTASATVIADDKVVVAELGRDVIAALQADPHAMASVNKALLLALFKKLKGANAKIEALMLK